jgi:hypothetical protein
MLAKVSTFLGPNGLFQGGGGTPSLVLSLDAINYSSWDASASGTWSDITNFNNDATSDGPISWSSEGGGSFEFDGSSAYFDFATVSGIPVGNSQYTMEAWFKSDSFGLSEQGTLVGWGNSGENYKSNVLRLNANGLTNYWWGDDISVSFTGTSSMYVDNWYYAAATYDGTTRKLYLNGNLVQSGTPSAPLEVDNISSLKIGYSYTNYFNGKISKVKVHSKALSGSKILSNFNDDKVRHGYVYGSMTFTSSNSSYLISSSNDYAFGTNDFTIEAFVKTSTLSGYDGIVSLSPLSTQVGPRINITNTGSFEFWTTNIAGPYNTFTVSNGQWYHVAMSRNSGTVSCFVNGQLQNQFFDDTNFTGQDLVVGRYYTDTNNHYIDGIISNVRVINGLGIYTMSSITIPETPLTSISNTKFLINSQQTSPSLDVSGGLHTVTASNIGWTSSLPEFYYYNYPDFSDTTGLNLYSYNSIISNQIYLTDLSNSNVGNIYTSDAIQYNRNFYLEFNFECKNGTGADGFCVQWTTANNVSGSQGGLVGIISDPSTINAFLFQTWFNNQIRHRENDTEVSSQANTLTFRQNVYYWMDYNYGTSTMYISYATTNAKPLTPQHTFTSVTFDSGNYYLGFGAANGGSNDNHILKSFKLSFV